MCRGEAGAEGGGGGGGRRTQSLFPSSSLGGRTSVQAMAFLKRSEKKTAQGNIFIFGRWEGRFRREVSTGSLRNRKDRTEISSRENFVSVSIFFNQK